MEGMFFEKGKKEHYHKYCDCTDYFTVSYSYEFEGWWNCHIQIIDV